MNPFVQKFIETDIGNDEPRDEGTLTLRYITTPMKLYLDKELNFSDMFLLNFIEMLDNEQGCFASNRYLARLMRGVTTITISNTISKLKRLGYITCTDRTDVNGLGQKRITRIIHVSDGYGPRKQTEFEPYKCELRGGVKADIKGGIMLALNNNKEEDKKEEENNFLSKDRKLTRDVAPTGPIAVRRSRPLLTLARQDIKRERPVEAPEPDGKGRPDRVEASQDAIDVVNHWNTKGKIFSSHKRLDTKGMKATLSLLDKKILPKFGYAAVKGAIDRAALMAHDKGLFTRAPRYKMSLPDFLTNESARFSKYPDKTPWFRRLLGEGSHLKFLRDRDRHPATTAKIKEAYERYTTGQRVEFSPKQETQFRQAAERLREYRSNGDRLAQYVTGAGDDQYVRVLFEALANQRKEGDSSDIVVGQLCSDYTWNSVLPRYLTKMYT